LQIIRGVIEDEMTRRVGAHHYLDGALGCAGWGQQRGYIVFAEQKVTVERPRVHTREGEESNSTATRGCNTMGGDSGIARRHRRGRGGMADAADLRKT
jgi:hypothetical protein